MKIIHNKKDEIYANRKSIFAAEDDDRTIDDEFDDFGESDMGGDEGVRNDKIEEPVESLNIQEDDSNIEIYNNISNHYIVECENCYGIFISALTESDQEVEGIKGICPLCEKETTQYAKWIVRDLEEDEEGEEDNLGLMI